MKIDSRNLKIMEVLAQNCRISDETIGRALRLSRDSVSYRIKQLTETGWINNHVLFIDARKLGFTRYHILIQFDSGIPTKALPQKIAQNPFVMWVNTFIGRFDLQLIVDARDGFHLNQIREEVFKACGNTIKHYSILTHLCDLEFTQLNPVIDSRTQFERASDQSFSKELAPRRFPVEHDFKLAKLDATDLELLFALADDPRLSLVAAGKRASCTRQTARQKISRLINQGVILNFGAIPNLSKLGFVTYYLLVRVEQKTSLDTLRRPFLTLNNIFYAGRMIGDYDLILYLNARNPEELHKSITYFKESLGKAIIQTDLLVQDHVHHWRQFTKGIYLELREKIQL